VKGPCLFPLDRRPKKVTTVEWCRTSGSAKDDIGKFAAPPSGETKFPKRQ